MAARCNYTIRLHHFCGAHLLQRALRSRRGAGLTLTSSILPALNDARSARIGVMLPIWSSKPRVIISLGCNRSMFEASAKLSSAQLSPSYRAWNSCVAVRLMHTSCTWTSFFSKGQPHGVKGPTGLAFRVTPTVLSSAVAVLAVDHFSSIVHFADDKQHISCWGGKL